MTSSDDQIECPLCMEPLEVDDLSFYPCTCGYQICRFCWHRLKTDGNGLCPACRKPYSDNPAHFEPLSEDEIIRIKKERRLKEVQKKQKLTENRRHLSDVRVVQKNLVFVVGLSPRLADPEVLKKNEYFGRFGKILKVVINPSPSYAGTQMPSASAYLTFSKPEEALRAIQTVNNLSVDNRILKTSLGTTKYCSHFLKSINCPKTDCMYLHDLGEEAASFTKDEMSQGKHLDYESKLIETYLHIPRNQQNITSSATPPPPLMSTTPLNTDQQPSPSIGSSTTNSIITTTLTTIQTGTNTSSGSVSSSVSSSAVTTSNIVINVNENANNTKTQQSATTTSTETKTNNKNSKSKAGPNVITTNGQSNRSQNSTAKISVTAASSSASTTTSGATTHGSRNSNRPSNQQQQPAISSSSSHNHVNSDSSTSLQRVVASERQHVDSSDQKNRSEENENDEMSKSSTQFFVVEKSREVPIEDEEETTPVSNNANPNVLDAFISTFSGAHHSTTTINNDENQPSLSSSNMGGKSSSSSSSTSSKFSTSTSSTSSSMPNASDESTDDVQQLLQQHTNAHITNKNYNNSEFYLNILNENKDLSNENSNDNSLEGNNPAIAAATNYIHTPICNLSSQLNKLGNSHVPEEDLGFDPWRESTRALHDLMQIEKINNNENKLLSSSSSSIPGASLNQYQSTVGGNGATMSQVLNNLKSPVNNLLLSQLMAAAAATNTQSAIQPSTKENLNMNNNLSHVLASGFNGLNTTLQYPAGLLVNQSGTGLANMNAAALLAAAKQQAASVLYENILQQNRKLLMQQQHQYQQQHPSGFEETNALVNGSDSFMNGNFAINGDENKSNNVIVPPPGFVNPSMTTKPITLKTTTTPPPPNNKPTPPSSSTTSLSTIDDPKNLVTALKSLFPHANVSIGAPSPPISSSSSSSSSSSYHRNTTAANNNNNNNISGNNPSATYTTNENVIQNPAKPNLSNNYWPDDPAIVSLTEGASNCYNNNSLVMNSKDIMMSNTFKFGNGILQQQLIGVMPNNQMFGNMNISNNGNGNLDSNVTKLSQIEQIIQQQQLQQQQQQYLSYQMLMQQLQHLPQQQQQQSQFGLNNNGGDQFNILKNIANHVSNQTTASNFPLNYNDTKTLSLLNNLQQYQYLLNQHAAAGATSTNFSTPASTTKSSND